ncbi:MAG: hypothetical protein JNL19_11445 [Burkholderiales bacterium]|nr:hypothetical protein [Burkholderiales bacterium]
MGDALLHVVVGAVPWVVGLILIAVPGVFLYGLTRAASARREVRRWAQARGFSADDEHHFSGNDAGFEWSAKFVLATEYGDVTNWTFVARRENALEEMVGAFSRGLLATRGAGPAAAHDQLHRCQLVRSAQVPADAPYRALSGKFPDWWIASTIHLGADWPAAEAIESMVVWASGAHAVNIRLTDSLVALELVASGASDDQHGLCGGLDEGGRFIEMSRRVLASSFVVSRAASRGADRGGSS